MPLTAMIRRMELRRRRQAARWRNPWRSGGRLIKTLSLRLPPSMSAATSPIHRQHGVCSRWFTGLRLLSRFFDHRTTRLWHEAGDPRIARRLSPLAQAHYGGGVAGLYDHRAARLWARSRRSTDSAPDKLSDAGALQRRSTHAAVRGASRCRFIADGNHQARCGADRAGQRPPMR